MAIQRGPKIVTSGLVLSLDAADKNSYPGTGTSWKDLSGNVNNGTLTNGPTYSNIKGGTIVFDGVDDYISVANSTSLQITSALTMEMWIYNTAAVTGLGVVTKGPISSDYDYMIYLTDNSNYAYFYKKDSLGNGYSVGSTVSLLNKWVHIMATHTSGGLAKVYTNGVEINSTTFANASIRSSSNNLQIGVGWSANYVGYISVCRIYNKALSATEVLQNYNATKSRFGLI